jgi:Leucine-rich repeat (LRR) protein
LSFFLLHTWMCDLISLRHQTDDKAVDPALWYCRHVNNLKLRMPAEVLKELPKDLARLKSLTTLIVSNNALKALPAEMAALKNLKNLEFTDNKVEKLPAELGTLTNLEVLDACRNKLSGVEALKTLHNLVTLKLDQNVIASLKEGMECKKLTRLSTLRYASASRSLLLLNRSLLTRGHPQLVPVPVGPFCSLIGLF